MLETPTKTTGDNWTANVANKGVFFDLKQVLINMGMSFDPENPNQLFLAFANAFQPVGTIIQNNGVVPGTHGKAGITWREMTEAKGAILVGSDVVGGLPVSPGQVAGSAQTCDPMVATNLIEHDHVMTKTKIDSPINYKYDGAPENDFWGPQIETPPATPSHPSQNSSPPFTPTQLTGFDPPSGITLTNLKRLGVVLWIRET